MKTNVNYILVLPIILVSFCCSKSNTLKSDNALVHIIKAENLDQQNYEGGNIYIIPEKNGDTTSYYIQTKDSGLAFIMDKGSCVQALNFEKQLHDKRVNTLFKIENGAFQWEINNGNELITVKLQNHNNSNFEIIRTKRY